jgi:hypothetical protein
MTPEEIEIKWKSITHGGLMPYRSLRINATCIPELYLAQDIKNNRFLILQVPEHIHVNCKSVEKEYLTIEWHESTRFILIGLRDISFSDLFNDLTLSLFNKIKDTSTPETYTWEFINTFHKWSDFFDNSSSALLTEPELKGLFGELIMLRWYLNDTKELTTDQILTAWQGPFNKAQDFIFPGYNVEVKTKETAEAYVTISSEYQLENEPGKGLLLAIVNVLRQSDGITLQTLITGIRNIILARGGDLSIFAGLIARSGLNFGNAGHYDTFIWKISSVAIHDCSGNAFPKITSGQLMTGIKQVTYRLYAKALEPFLIQTFIP